MSKLELTDDERRDGLTCAVLLLGGLDELLLAVPAVRAVRSQLPRHTIVLAGHPAVGRAAVDWGVTDGWVHARAWHMPRMTDLDVAVNLSDAGPESHRLLLQQRPRRLVASASPAAGVSGPHWFLREGGDRALVEHRSARWCRIVAASFQMDVDPRDGLLTRALTGQRGSAGAVVVHPGGASALRWPAERYAAVIACLAEGGADVRVLGLPGEDALVAAVVAGALRQLPGTAAARVTGVVPESIPDLTSTVAGARLVVAGDGVVGHLAAACAVAGVHLHGRTSPRERGPMTVARRARVLHAPQAAPAEDPVLGISVEQVLAATSEILAGVVPPAARTPRPLVST